MKNASQKSIKSYSDLLNIAKKVAASPGKPLRELTENEVGLVSGALGKIYRGCGACR